MRRETLTPRSDWQSKLEALGLMFHTHDDGTPYWREDACYVFRAEEVARIQRAAEELQRLCLLAMDHLLQQPHWDAYAIPRWMIPVIRESWERDEVGLYGRFDLAYDGVGNPRLLEYNADTPTSLVEAAVVQWYWLQERFPGCDQFNALHERLVEAWKRAQGQLLLGPVYFLYQDTWEDHQTVAYLRETADQAGLETAQLMIEDVGWDSAQRCFVDLDGRPIRNAFKLYPWEFLVKDAFRTHLTEQPRPCAFLEPAWKMLWSNKAILATLWELFPDCPYLLPSYLDGPRDMANYVRKPILAREGANVALHRSGMPVVQGHTMACYGDEGHVFQAYAQLPDKDGHTPVLGVWVVDGEVGGMGIRESLGPITDNSSCFVPHRIER